MVKKFRRRSLLLALGRNTLLVIVLSALIVGVVFVAEYFGRFESFTRTVLFWMSLLAITVLWIVQVIRRSIKLFLTPSHQELIEWAKKLEPKFGDGAAVALELDRNIDDLGLLAVATIEERWMNFDVYRAIDWTYYKRFFFIWLGVFGFFAITSFTLPKNVWNAGTRLVNYGLDKESFAPFSFRRIDDVSSVYEYEDVEIVLQLVGNELPDEVFIVEGESSRRMNLVGDTYKHTFRKLVGDISFSFSAAGFESKPHKIKVLSKPSLLSSSVRLTYPSYLKKKPETVLLGKRLEVPQGTDLDFEFHVEHVEEGVLLSNQGVIEDRQFEADSNTVLSFYSISNGLDSLLLKRFDIAVVKDAYPVINNLSENLTEDSYYGRVNFSDDYGFHKVDLVLEVDGKIRHTWAVGFQEDLANQSSIFNVRFVDQLKEGEQGDLFLEVFDNDRVNGFKSVRSRKTYISRLTNEEVKAESMKSFSYNLEKLDKLNREIAELKERKNKLSLEQKEGDLSKQEYQRNNMELDSRMSDLQRDLNSVLKELKNDVKKSEFEESKDVEDRLDELVNEDMQEKLNELERLQDSLGLEPDVNNMSELELENLEEQLDRTLEMLKRLEVEKQMEDWIEKYQDLAEKQEELSDEDNDVTADQEKLNEEIEDLREELDKIHEKNKDLENPSDLPQESDFSSGENDRQDAVESLEKNNSGKANKSQRSAAEKMKQDASNAMNMMNHGAEKQSAEDMAQLRLIRKRLVNYSVDQEQLMKSMSALNASDVSYNRFVQSQELMNREMIVLEDSLMALSKRNVQIQSTVIEELNNWEISRNEAVEFHVERKRSSGLERQQQAMMSANRLALLLDEAINQMQQQQQQQMQGAAACKKPGGKNSQQMKSNAEKQGELNKQMKKLKDSLEGEGGKPNDGIKGGGSKGSSEAFSKAALEQKRLREGLRKLMESQGSGADGLSQSMKKMMREMEKVEDDLINKRLTQETIMRQQSILQQMLESEKAMREQEEDEQRESNSGDDVDNSVEDDVLEEYLRSKERELELLRREQGDLRKYYKGVINQFYNTSIDGN